MRKPADIFGPAESLRSPLIASTALHGAIAALLTLNPLMVGGQHRIWGDLKAGQGFLPVNTLPGVPLPAREDASNPVANDSQSQVPQAQTRGVERPEAKEPASILLKGTERPKNPSHVVAGGPRYRPTEEQRPNQLVSFVGPRLSTRTIGRKTGGNDAGPGDFTLGDRFAGYARHLHQLVSQQWSTADIDPRIRTASPVIVHFTIMRDGTIKDVTIEKSSGNLALDLSAQRAIADVGRAPELPSAYERNEARIEFWFELKR